MAATFLTSAAWSGATFWTFSLFVKPLQDDLGWNRGSITGAFTGLFVALGISAPFLGRLVDRYGPKRVISVGATVVGLGFALLSLVNALWQFYIVYVIIGVGTAAVGHVPATALISNWFSRRRGLAIGIMSIGLGVGGIVLTPVVGGYLLPAFGWKTSYLMLGLLTYAVIIPLALLVIKNRPGDMGLLPDGLKTSSLGDVPAVTVPASEGCAWRMLLTTPAIWLIGVTFLFSNLSGVGTVQSQVPYLADIGFPIATSAAALGAVSLISAVSKGLFGLLCDRIGPKHSCLIGLFFQAGGTLILMAIRPSSPLIQVWAYALITGLGDGMWSSTMPMLVSTSFGLAAYGAIFGIVSMMANLGTATGPLVASLIYDSLNTYYWAFAIFLGLYLVAAVAILVLPKPRFL